MTWLTWRQHRVALLIGVLLLAFYAFILLGRNYDAFTFQYEVVMLLPLLVAVFVGAPLVSRERAQKTHYVAWLQGTSRTRWLVIKLALLVAGVLVLATVLAFLENVLQDMLVGDGPFEIWSRYLVTGPVVVGLTLFGLMLGVLVGSLTRRSILAMALTFVLYVACFLLFSGNYGNLVPPHVQYMEYHGNGYWGQQMELVIYAGFADRQGQETGDIHSYCNWHDSASNGNVNKCIRDLNLQWKTVYQTEDDYWPLQYAGGALLLVLSLLFGILAIIRVRTIRD
ncbi:transporter [Ktedonobacter sp. SOSP1-85]|uniref:ABC transporter permease n=1 Tax=Ktedonobacter sp. SOSP1-85 TaxID=2778367 RepID=UPI00191542C2|nr:ABC transporter permease subunit [Ktedonobacter sp. SOSP1-85]GHO80752.1 transporter [Ktedonobacter sp. SOSP1-85]